MPDSLSSILQLLIDAAVAKEDLGSLIRNFRYRHNLPQKQLAKSLHVTSTFLSDVENGRRFPSLTTLQQLQSIISTSDLLPNGPSPSNQGEQTP